VTRDVSWHTMSRWLGCLAVSCGASCIGCSDVSRFDTGDGGAYCGDIVEGEFVRQRFPGDVRMRLTLDTSSLDDFPGTLSTNDYEGGTCSAGAEFTDAPLRAIDKVREDPLSMLRFGDAQEANVLAYVDSACRGPMMAVVSLLRDDGVEVRLLRPAPLEDDGTSETAFGLFSLRRTDCTFDPPSAPSP